MSILLRVIDITRDRRSAAQLASARALDQERLDQALEREWRERVRENISRRLDKRIQQLLSNGEQNG